MVQDFRKVTNVKVDCSKFGRLIPTDWKFNHVGTIPPSPYVKGVGFAGVSIVPKAWSPTAEGGLSLLHPASTGGFTRADLPKIEERFCFLSQVRPLLTIGTASNTGGTFTQARVGGELIILQSMINELNQLQPENDSTLNDKDEVLPPRPALLFNNGKDKIFLDEIDKIEVLT